MVHCLDEDIYQIINLYSCTSSECDLSTKAFNPTPRFDYSDRSLGVDIVRFIAKEFLQLHATISQIHNRLRLEHPHLSISIDTIARVCDDLLELKAFRIDQRTSDIITAQHVIILGLDGQDPGGDFGLRWSGSRWHKMWMMQLMQLKFSTVHKSIIPK